MNATATTTIRATDLPLPEVTPVGEPVRFGSHSSVRLLQPVTIGGQSLLLGRQSGRVYVECWRCSGRGHLAHYAGIYGGQCFACVRSGVRLYAETVEQAQRKARSAQAKALREQAKWEAGAAEREAAAAAAFLADWEAALAEDTRRAQEAAERAAKEATLRFLGTVGEKVTVTGTVQVALTLEGFYGTRMMVVLAGEGEHAGVTLKTVGTAQGLWDLERGQKVTMSGTVKEHATYDDPRQGISVPQTVVTRVKVA